MSLKVYNVLGEEVATLVNEEMEPGSYTVAWDASGKPSGVYYAKMVATAPTGAIVFQESRKLVLVK